MSESSAPGTGFLVDVTREWEAATAPAEAAGIRVVHLRLGWCWGRVGERWRRCCRPSRREPEGASARASSG
ncbi:hypothetical protein [Cystobacter fuscus]|uniref:hypothetical protein n=1 Tax=Cystobacter fuscus TaxID=43 RepID=UPI0037BFFCE9